jgi:hypothetical protein
MVVLRKDLYTLAKFVDENVSDSDSLYNGAL